MAIEITSGDIFTPEQLEKHAKVYAGPGAGKTHFLVENIKNIVTTNSLITQSRMRKVLCVTYTNSAVNEIKRRLDRFTEHVEVYTIHGFIIEHIIRPFQQNLREIMESDFRINVGSKGIISSQVEGLGILHGIDKNEIYDFIRKTNPLEFSDDDFGYSKKVMGEVEVDNDAYVSSFTESATRCMKLKAPSTIDKQHVLPIKKYIWSIVRKLTHNEILYFGYRILESNPIALYAIRVKFPFIFVDEFQDTNPLQTLLIKLIGQKSTFIGVVGDIAQSIYSFQGAQPTDFKNFSIDGSREINEYVINGNRRSTENIVNFCNYLRQSDSDVVQVSDRTYGTVEEKVQSEAKKIHFLMGKSVAIYNIIKNVLKNNGVVLTRTWAAAFDYIQGVDETQVELLKKIYYSYYNSPIQLRDEIAEHNNVTWVRAFRFIFNLWKSYLNGSFIDAIQAFNLYAIIDIRKVTPKAIFQISRLSSNIFSNVSEQSYTCEIINKFNTEIEKPDFTNFRETFLGSNFTIPVFDDLDNEKLTTAVTKLFWGTSYKLFTDVFSENSKYMTVHQAKGLEWDKVIVSVAPNRFDEIKIADLYSNPQLMTETPADEFTRMYYVACSRAREDLYVHISDESIISNIQASISDYKNRTGKRIEYEVIV